MRRRILSIFCIGLAGCAAIAPSPPQAVLYRCDGGREFSVAYHPAGDSATIEIARMRFALEFEAAAGSARRYGCSVLTLWQDGAAARVEMEGAGLYANCRQQE